MRSKDFARWRLIAALLSICHLKFAMAQEREDCKSGRIRPPTVNVRLDNDVFGGQDQGYTNGVQISLVSPDLRSFTDPCLPKLAQWINGRLGALQSTTFDQQNMVVTFTQAIYTPTDSGSTNLIETDRPYAAVLLVGLGYSTRWGDRMHTTQLQAGVVGPAASGEQVQNHVHGLIGAQKFRGWSNQLSNEPLVRLLHEGTQRLSSEGKHGEWDVIPHYGVSLGNLATYINAGAELRFGTKLPDDFGSAQLSPAAGNATPAQSSRIGAPSVHMFTMFDVRWVLHDITLDGNTFRKSHSVERRRFVANIGYGVALIKPPWQFSLARYHSTREFDAQKDTPVFGSFTVSRAF